MISDVIYSKDPCLVKVHPVEVGLDEHLPEAGDEVVGEQPGPHRQTGRQLQEIIHCNVSSSHPSPPLEAGTRGYK